MKYTPRLTAPSSTNKNYIHNTKGGYNYCIHIANGSCLPNCVGYAWGRWREILGKYHYLSKSNAENWWGYTDGYKRGDTPKVGAVICWRKGEAGVGADGAGHVAIVEEVKPDGTIITSNSAYSGKRFYTQTLKPPYKLGSNYVLQGFIYLPLEFDGATTNKELTTEEQIKKVSVNLAQLSRGAVGAQVKTLQHLLTAFGFTMTAGGKTYGADGSFGAATENAVIAFQKSRGLAQDGIVGKNTWCALLGC